MTKRNRSLERFLPPPHRGMALNGAKAWLLFPATRSTGPLLTLARYGLEQLSAAQTLNVSISTSTRRRFWNGMRTFPDLRSSNDRFALLRGIFCICADTTTELVHQFKTSEVKLVLSAPANLQAVLTACEKVGLPTSCVVLFDTYDSQGRKEKRIDGYLYFSDLLETGNKLPKVEVVKMKGKESSESLALLPYSSG